MTHFKEDADVPQQVRRRYRQAPHGTELEGGVEGEALLHMEELGNYTLKYLARRRTRKPPHDLVTGQTPDYMLSN